MKRDVPDLTWVFVAVLALVVAAVVFLGADPCTPSMQQTSEQCQ